MKRRFIRCTAREQILLVVFTVLAGVIWVVSATGRVRLQWRDYQAVQADAVTQQFWLDRQGEIEARTAAAASDLDPAKTYAATRLVSEINAMARSAGLTINTESPRTTHTSNFAVHSVQVQCRRSSMAALLKFYEELGRRAPYIGLEQCSLQVERGAADQLNANLRITSVEIVRNGAKK